MYTNNKSTGVYFIVCLVNGFRYVGSAASCDGFQKRLTKHRAALKRGIHHSPILQKHFDRYGIDAFQFLVMEECPPADCVKREQFWIDWFGVGSENKSYNICSRAAIAPSPKGRKDSPETIAKRIASNKANPWTAEMKAKAHAIVAEANSKSYVATSPEGIEYPFKNLAKFCRQNNLCTTNMVNSAKAKTSHHKGWQCRYAEETKEEHQAKIKLFLDSSPRQYILTSPKGIEYKTNKLKDFCQENNLSFPVIRSVAIGNARMHKDWFCRYTNEPEYVKQKRLLQNKKEKRGAYNMSKTKTL